MSKLFLQLYSLRRETAVDAAAVVFQVPSLGFDGIELAGDYGWPREVWRDVLAETGLEIVGAHVGLPDVEGDLADRLNFHQALGNRRLIVSSLPEELRTTGDGYREGARRLNEAGRELRGKGFTLHYHHHAFEFGRLADGARGMDILLEELDRDTVGFEVDTYWVERAGLDSAAFLREHAERVSLIHAKDLRKKENLDVAAGEGDVDFKAIVPLAEQHGWPIIAEYEGESAVEAALESARNLRSLFRE